jgi:hypothetical protein
MSDYISPVDLASYLEAVLRAGIKEKEASPHEFSTNVNPSAISPMFCTKRHVLSRLARDVSEEEMLEEELSESDYNLGMKLWIGIKVEDLIGQLLSENIDQSWKVERGVVVKKDGWSGVIDYLLDERIPVEVKYSVKDISPALKENYIFQLASYMHILGYYQGAIVNVAREGGIGIWIVTRSEHSFYVYNKHGKISKNKWQFLPGDSSEVEVTFDEIEKRFKEHQTALRLVALDPHALDGIPGEQYNVKKPGWQCYSKKSDEYCPFYNSCYKSTNIEVIQHSEPLLEVGLA